MDEDLVETETSNILRRDFSQEEIHHLIFIPVRVPTFPKAFSGVPADRSTLFLTGRYTQENGFYNYNDPISASEY